MWLCHTFMLKLRSSLATLVLVLPWLDSVLINLRLDFFSLCNCKINFSSAAHWQFYCSRVLDCQWIAFWHQRLLNAIGSNTINRRVLVILIRITFRTLLPVRLPFVLAMLSSSPSTLWFWWNVGWRWTLLRRSVFRTTCGTELGIYMTTQVGCEIWSSDKGILSRWATLIHHLLRPLTYYF